MKIGIIGSSGGSVVNELARILDVESHQFIIVTDRDCGLVEVATNYSMDHIIINDRDNKSFSQQARQYFDQQGGVDFVLLFYLRLVTEELFYYYPTFNIHPSLLPEYKGFHAIERAFEDKVDKLGATLHLVDKGIDQGPVIAQVSTPLDVKRGVDHLHRISFAQKTFLALFLIEKVASGALTHDNCKKYISSSGMAEFQVNPVLKSPILNKAYLDFVIREGLEDGV